MDNQIQKAPARLSSLLQTPDVQKRFQEVLGKKASGFLSSILSATASNPALKDCEPMSVISSAMIAATLDLPINASLGMAYIIPFKGKATFQLGVRGLSQLALRSGQFKTLNVTKVLEGQITKHNPFTGEMEFKNEADSEKVVGYLMYFKLLNGFEKYHYWTAEECDAHGKRFSQTYKRGFGLWKDDFDAMALKTVLKSGLTKYAPLSIEMQTAIEADQGVTIDGTVTEYPDNPAPEPKTLPSDVPTLEGKLADVMAKKVHAKEEMPNDFDPSGEYEQSNKGLK